MLTSEAPSSLACTPAFASVSKPVTLSCSYANPTSGTLPVRVGGTPLANIDRGHLLGFAVGPAPVVVHQRQLELTQRTGQRHMGNDEDAVHAAR